MANHVFIKLTLLLPRMSEVAAGEVVAERGVIFVAATHIARFHAPAEGGQAAKFGAGALIVFNEPVDTPMPMSENEGEPEIRLVRGLAEVPVVETPDYILEMLTPPPPSTQI